MNDNKMLIIASEPSGGDSYQIYEDYDTGSLRIDTGAGGELISLNILGTFDPNSNTSTPSVGYTDEEGGTTLEVRMTGERMLDGEEFVSLMKRINSPAYGGEYDDEHFIYIANNRNGCNVVSPNHFSMPTTPNTFRMTATLNEDICSGGALVPGLHFKYRAGSTSSIRAASSGVGDVTMSGTSYSGNIFSGFIHKATSKYMELPIRYDSVTMFAGKVEPSAPYWCQKAAFRLGSPLMSSIDGTVYDELECISGILTRRIGTDIIDDSYEISDAIYCGIPCQRISLKGPIGESRAMIGDYVEDNIDCFAEFGDCLVLPPERDCIYIRVSDEPDLESAIDYILGSRLVYELAKHEEIQLEQRLEPRLASGANIICVCTEHSAEIYTTYKVKE